MQNGSGNYQFKIAEILNKRSGQIPYLAVKLREFVNRLVPVEDHPNTSEVKEMLATMHSLLTQFEECTETLSRLPGVSVQQLNHLSKENIVGDETA